MANYFFDSSALTKRFAQEIGSEWVNSLCHLSARHDIYIAVITGAEVTAALARRKLENTSGDNFLTDAIHQFRYEFITRYRVVEIKSDLISMAMFMAEKHFLRGYDSVQLATAFVLNHELQVAHSPTLTFVSADNDLNTAARKENLLVENPNDHH